MRVDLDQPPAPSAELPEFLTVQEVADLFRQNPSHIARQLRAGLWPGAFKLPGGMHWRIPRASVAAQMASTWEPRIL